MCTYIGAKLAILIPSHCLLLFSGLHRVHLGCLFSSRVPVWWVVLESHHLRGENLTFLRPRGSEVLPEGEAVVLGRLVSEEWAEPGFRSQHCFWLNDLGHITLPPEALFPSRVKDRDWTGGHGVSEWAGLGSAFCSGWGAWGCWGALEGTQDFRLPSLRKCRRGERCDGCLQANKIEHF